MIPRNESREIGSGLDPLTDAYLGLIRTIKYRIRKVDASGAFAVSLHIKPVGDAIRLVQVDGVAFDNKGQSRPVVMSRQDLTNRALVVLTQYRETPDFEDAIMILTAPSLTEEPTIEVWWDEEARARAIDGYNWADRAQALNPMAQPGTP